MGTETLYKTMHWTCPGYQEKNQGMFVLSDWLHLLRDDQGRGIDYWSDRKTSVIEVGCGNGQLCELLSYLGFQVTGTDIVEGPYDRKGYQFIIQDLSGPLGFLDNEFDYCLSFDVMEHIEEKYIDDALREMGRIARHIIMKVACSGTPPLHITVKSAGWWLNRLILNCSDYEWSVVRLFNMYPENEVKTAAPLFYGKKVLK